MAKRVGRKEDVLWNMIKSMSNINEVFDELDKARLSNQEMNKLADDWKKAKNMKKTHGI